MERTIRVTGKGKISVKPDTVRLLITQTDLKREYGNAVEASTEKKAELNAVLGELGFDKTDLKTLYFNVSSEYQSYQAKDKSWRSRFIGYRYVHRMKLEFPADNELLGRVLYKLAHSGLDAEFSIEYTVHDPEATKNDLLGKAVADANRKAEVLSSAASVRLGDVQLIDYSWGEIEIVSKPMGRDVLYSACVSKDESYSMDIEPDDIDLTDTVTVVWTIE